MLIKQSASNERKALKIKQNITRKLSSEELNAAVYMASANSGFCLVPVSRKSRKVFGLEKPFVKVRPAYSVKLVFFICCKENKN